MNKEDVRFLYNYNHWANIRILTSAAKTSSDQFLGSASYPYGGLRSTLTHILFAEWIWRLRWMGISPEHRLKPEDFPTYESLLKRWQQEEKELSRYIDDLDDEKLNTTFQYKTTRGEPMEVLLWQAMAHVVNHGTQHRSEAAMLLTDFGFSPGDIDLIIFLREMK